MALNAKSSWTLDAALKEAHSTWIKKKAYTGKLDWVPKYTEKEVGIKEFITDGGFAGVVKATWADFIVQEVRLRDGSVVTLPGNPPASAKKKRELNQVYTDPGIEDKGQEGIFGLRFILCKMGLDTITAIREIATACRAPYTNFRFAGIKDKYGVTTQEVTVHGVSAERLLRFNSGQSRQSGGKIIIDGIRRCDAPLHSGELHGNRFVIVVRNVTAPDEDLRKGIASLKKSGFINYFGMQRFGGGSVDSIAAGRALLNSDAKTFAELLFSPERASDKREVNAKRRFLKDGDMRKALANLPPYCSNERLFLEFRLQGRSVSKAVGSIPYKSMYEQSYTSALWNEACSKRVEAYGMNPAPGDIVLLSTSGGGEKGKKFQTVKVVSKKDIKARRFSICDVVLPMLTQERRVIVPQNKVGRWLQRRLQKEGLGDLVEVVPVTKGHGLDANGATFQGIREGFEDEMAGGRSEAEAEEEAGGGREAKRRGEGGEERGEEAGERQGEGFGEARAVRVPGMCKFRPLVARPQDLSWCLRRYSRADDLVFAGEDSELRDGGEGPHKGIVLAFTLQAGCYATMLLRELMHADSSWNTHHQVMSDLLAADCSDADKKETARRQKNAERFLRAKRRKALKRRKAIKTALSELPLNSFLGKRR